MYTMCTHIHIHEVARCARRREGRRRRRRTDKARRAGGEERKSFAARCGKCICTEGESQRGRAEDKAGGGGRDKESIGEVLEYREIADERDRV